MFVAEKFVNHCQNGGQKCSWIAFVKEALFDITGLLPQVAGAKASESEQMKELHRCSVICRQSCYDIRNTIHTYVHIL